MTDSHVQAHFQNMLVSHMTQVQDQLNQSLGHLTS